jgi:hypothetical protein
MIIVLISDTFCTNNEQFFDRLKHDLAWNLIVNDYCALIISEL